MFFNTFNTLWNIKRNEWKIVIRHEYGGRSALIYENALRFKMEIILR